ncbi:MAG: phosphoribosylglycinamide formyltransferase [Betaproteobacteria bacterium]|nr:phosphoribosylglycinamide formyltransferase [Rhodocyclaceae bacterium]MCA3134476.1 phosphoribosylglycinamide formyltransferase [Rhodocyclaceae bacterium]MCA3143958.1 phosphoribosylglycinamide formyltransferase [Rhodocyclaceae bacterium]MCA3145667.1 phosphoribosylglycinamide formyltransferase [Rhodocyclaceae bacterium]MCE2898547.1 phosphoribosylglycinamide formyltransferase [Betaproteobacteria bacterium]
MARVVVLISGRGSNLRALVEAALPVVAVVSNRPDAAGLGFAAERGIATAVVDHKAYADRDSFDTALANAVDAHAPDLVVLAGFMRVLTPGFVRRYAGRLMNVHPSLLPAFPGLDTHARALAAGSKLHGCSVHFVTEALDEGPIVAQAAVPVLDDDSPETLAARVLRQEHRLLPAAVRWFLEGRMAINGARVRVRDTVAHADDTLAEPAP